MSDPAHHAALRAHFGFPAFRPGQEQAVRAALADRDVLVVMPTGAGKSLCYQLPALMRDDLTLVVSPLVSLMQDQVDALGRRAPGRVALVNAQQTPADNAAAVAAAVRGDVRILYVAPERFSSPRFTHAVAEARVGLFVVDEAHCVSQWGHDFRPDYLRLADAARGLGARAIVASTATATPQVAADVEAELGLRDPVRVSTGFDRPNLSYAVVPSSAPDRDRQLVAALTAPDAIPAIVYAGTRRDVDALAAMLAGALGRPVLAYHAGLGRAERAAAHRRFMGGAVDVVVATTAFGMGVDKPDVRTVVHATVPPSLEAYYQEAGRAGRDGAPARALLLAAAGDKALHVSFMARAEVTGEEIERVALRLAAAAGGPPPATFDVGVHELGGGSAAGAVSGDRVRAILGSLARAGVIEPAPAPVDRARGRMRSPFDPQARAACRAIAGDAQRARRRQYRAIWGFVDSEGCRRAAVLAHFGDPARPAPHAGCCDACDSAVVVAGVARPVAGAAPSATADALRTAVVAVVAAAGPALDRDGVATVLRGRRSRAVRRDRLDGLPGYAAWSDVGEGEVLAAVDALLATGRLIAADEPSSGLRVASAAHGRAA